MGMAAKPQQQYDIMKNVFISMLQKGLALKLLFKLDK
jgi:hypothetical protein